MTHAKENTLHKNVLTIAKEFFGGDVKLLRQMGRDFVFLVDGEAKALRYSCKGASITLVDETGVGIIAEGTSRSMFETDKKKKLPFKGEVVTVNLFPAETPKWEKIV